MDSNSSSAARAGFKSTFLSILLIAGSISLGFLLLLVPPFHTFMIVAVIGVVLVTFIRPEWSLLVWVFLTYTRLTDIAVEHGYPSIAKPYLVLLLVTVLARSALHMTKPVGWLRPAALLGGFGLVNVASILFAADPSLAREGASIVVKEIIVAIVLVLLLQRAATFRNVIYAVLAAGILMGTISVYQALSSTFSNSYWGFGLNPPRNSADYGRIAGSMHPNNYAQILVVLVPFAIERLFTKSALSLRVLAAWALVVSVLSIVFTYSRAGFLGLLLVIGIIGFRIHFKLKHFVIMLALCLAVLPILPDRYYQRVRTIFELVPGSSDSSKTDTSFEGRTVEMLAAWKVFTEHPVLGVGTYNFHTLYQESARSQGLDPLAEDRGAANLYLEVAAELGIIGICSFGLILFVLFRTMRESRKKLLSAGRLDYARMIAALEAGFIGYLFTSFFLGANNYPRFLWLLIGIILSVPQVVSDELARDRSYDSILKPRRQAALVLEN